jgi:hypothetical protein
MSRPADYVADRAINWSLLKLLDKSPAHYRHAVEHPDEGDTASRTMLRAAHMAILEPDRFAAEVVVYDGGVRRGKAWDAFAAQHAGCVILNEREWATVTAARDAIARHPVASRLLSGGHAEVVLRWTDEATGRACKGIADYLHEPGSIDDRPVLVDLKGCQSVDPEAFARDCARMGYHGQMAHYAAGVEARYGVAPIVYLVGYESAAPHDVGVFLLSDDDLWLGEQFRRRLLDRLMECERTNTWPGRCPEVVTLDMPAWAWRRDDPDTDDDDTTDALGGMEQ